MPSSALTHAGSTTSCCTSCPVRVARTRTHPHHAPTHVNPRRFYHELLHLVSLLFALKMKHLRKDWGLNNVYTHRMSAVPPMLVRADQTPRLRLPL